MKNYLIIVGLILEGPSEVFFKPDNMEDIIHFFKIN